MVSSGMRPMVSGGWERVGLYGWLAVLIGFAGVIALLQPGTDAFSFWTLLPLTGAFFYAWAHIITRAKCQSHPLITLALSVNLTLLIAGLSMSFLFLNWRPDESLVQSYPYLFGEWKSVGASQWAILVVLAFLSIVISVLLAGAYRVAAPSKVAIFEYAYLVFVVGWDIMIFATTPDFVMLAGMAMIIMAGTMIIRREASRK